MEARVERDITENPLDTIDNLIDAGNCKQAYDYCLYLDSIEDTAMDRLKLSEKKDLLFQKFFVMQKKLLDFFNQNLHNLSYVNNDNFSENLRQKLSLFYSSTDSSLLNDEYFNALRKRRSVSRTQVEVHNCEFINCLLARSNVFKPSNDLSYAESLLEEINYFKLQSELDLALVYCNFAIQHLTLKKVKLANDARNANLVTQCEELLNKVYSIQKNIKNQNLEKTSEISTETVSDGFINDCENSLQDPETNQDSMTFQEIPPQALKNTFFANSFSVETSTSPLPLSNNSIQPEDKIIDISYGNEQINLFASDIPLEVRQSFEDFLEIKFNDEKIKIFIEKIIRFFNTIKNPQKNPELDQIAKMVNNEFPNNYKMRKSVINELHKYYHKARILITALITNKAKNKNIFTENLINSKEAIKRADIFHALFYEIKTHGNSSNLRVDSVSNSEDSSDARRRIVEQRMESAVREIVGSSSCQVLFKNLDLINFEKGTVEFDKKSPTILFKGIYLNTPCGRNYWEARNNSNPPGGGKKRKADELLGNTNHIHKARPAVIVSASTKSSGQTQQVTVAELNGKTTDSEVPNKRRKTQQDTGQFSKNYENINGDSEKTKPFLMSKKTQRTGQSFFQKKSNVDSEQTKNRISM